MPVTERRAGACAEATSTTASGRLSAALKRESVWWKAAVAWRRFDDEDAPKQEFGAAEI